MSDVNGTGMANATDDLNIADLFANDPAVKGCPFAHFAKVREMPGLYFAPDVEAYLITRYADAVEIFSDSERFSSKIPFGRVAMRKEREAIDTLRAGHPELDGLFSDLRPRRIPMLASADPPVHKRQRRLVQAAFSPKRLGKAEPWLRQTTERLVDGFAEDELVDAVPALTVPLPVSAIAILMGVDDNRQAQFKRWSDSFFSGGNGDADQVTAALHGQVELFAYIAEQIAENRARPSDSIIADVLEASERTDDPLSVPEMQAMFSQLLVAGNETTTGLLGSCLLTLARRADLFDALAESPDAIPRFVDEVLRREFPVAANFRTVTCDTTVGGVPVEAGSQLMILQGAVNNDPARFGDRDLTTDFAVEGRHVTFGGGIHFCVGAPLARLEARIVVETVTQRFATLSLEPGETLRYAPFYMNRALSYLPVRVVRRNR